MWLLSENEQEPVKLTQSVVQITDLLGLYRAETASILKLNCTDIGDFFSGRRTLPPSTQVWELAGRFVKFYNQLYRRFSGDGIAMCHWLRAHNEQIGKSPLLAMVDDQQLEKVITLLETQPNR